MIKIKENVFKNYPNNIKYRIITSVELVNFYSEWDEEYFKDWTFIIFSIIIALEGYIKWLSIKSQIPFKKNINYFDLREHPYKLKSNLSYDLDKYALIKIIEDCYNIYISYRNKICHYELGYKYDYSFVLSKSKALKIFNEIYSCFKEIK